MRTPSSAPTWAKDAETYAKEFGYKVVADISYAANATDVTSEVGRLIKAKPDVVMHASYITDAILFTKTFKEMGFVPKGFMTMAGYIEPGYLPAVKADGNYFIVRSTFALDLAKKKPLVAQVNALFKKKYNIDMSENAARSFTAPFVLADAINRAKIDGARGGREGAPRDEHPGRPGHLPVEGHPVRPEDPPEHPRAGMLVQIQNQNYVTVWPFESASRGCGLAVPAWKTRK